MREWGKVVLFVLAVGVTAAGLLKLIGQGATRQVVSILWALGIAVLWGLWYIA